MYVQKDGRIFSGQDLAPQRPSITIINDFNFVTQKKQVDCSVKDQNGRIIYAMFIILKRKERRIFLFLYQRYYKMLLDV